MCDDSSDSQEQDFQRGSQKCSWKKTEDNGISSCSASSYGDENICEKGRCPIMIEVVYCGQAKHRN